MIRVGVTGPEGLIGWHLRCFLSGEENIEILLADRKTFADAAALDRWTRQVDAVVHLAGMIRGEDALVKSVNEKLAANLIAAFEQTGRVPHLIFSNSIHWTRDTAYGQSKRACVEIFEKWAQRTGGRFTNLVLPHVFGEGGRPFFNSAVHTFCHQLVSGEKPRVIKDVDLTLLHAQEAVEQIHAILQDGTGGRVEIPGNPLTVSGLLSRLQTLAEAYSHALVPDLRAALDLQLFNTYRSYLFPGHYPVKLKRHADARGELFEAVRELNGGQTYISTTRPGITRGNHFHRHKIERFLVLNGEAVIRIRRMFSPLVREFHVSGREPQFLDIPTLHTHNITNTGSGELTTLFWSHELFDPAFPDTIPADV
ncbi:MAG: NAD-dependent epimerase/dehydratase family protein [Nitrospinaceae bacterium]